MFNRCVTAPYVTVAGQPPLAPRALEGLDIKYDYYNKTNAKSKNPTTGFNAFS